MSAIRIWLSSVLLILLVSCSAKTEENFLPLFEAVLQLDSSNENPVWVIAESDTAYNHMMFGMEICSAEFFKRSLQGKNRMILGDIKAVMTIWDCFSTCLNNSKEFRFTASELPKAVRLVGQSQVDSLQRIVNSQELNDDIRREAYTQLHSKSIYSFSEPIFFDKGRFAFFYYINYRVNAGYMVWEKNSETWVKVHQQIYEDFENDFVIPPFSL